MVRRLRESADPCARDRGEWRARRLVAVLGVLLCVPVVPCPGQQNPNPVRAAIPVADSNRTLGVGDEVTYQVMEDRDPAVRLVVTDAGELDIPYLGRVKVAGMSVASARSAITRLLEEKYYHNATVRLAIDTVARSSGITGTVYLSGKVNTPGPQQLFAGEEPTAGKLILRAGGLAEFADSRKVKIVRKSEGGQAPVTEVVDLREVLERGRIDKDVPVRDGDLIIVPQKTFNW